MRTNVLTLLLAFVPAAIGFVSSEVSSLMKPPIAFAKTSTVRRHVQANSSNFLLDEFSIYNGEVLDPYQVLKVHRSADRKEIREKYINLSRRYHPDVVMHKDILPGSWYVCTRV